MPENKNLLQCYNRGCGKQYDPSSNDKDECCHHPGTPVFHDAYKGWSCCSKKSVDFTEFLNIKGCTQSQHSNVKPPEPEKKPLDKELDKKTVIEVRAPVLGPQLTRPPFDTPLVTIQASIANAIKQNITKISKQTENSSEGTVVGIGTTCKNGGCNVSYEGPQSNSGLCTYHPGCPVFHEGLKFWSCCQKRTTDFNTFLSQPGCTSGTHKWFKENAGTGKAKCRWDWHQTPDFVIVSVYAKNYEPRESFVKVNPIRLHTKLVFCDEANSVFELDLELRGVVDINNSTASMLSTKIEIKLKKAEPGAWSKLDFPRKEPEAKVEPVAEPVEDDDSVDLSTVEAIHSIGKVNVSG